ASRQRRPYARRTTKLATLARLQFDVVNRHAQRNILQRERVANRRRSVRTAHHLGPRLQSLRSQDVPLLAIHVVQQGDPRTAVWIVLNRVHLGRHPVLLPPEVDQAVLPLVTATTMPGRNLPLVVPPPLLPKRHQQALFRLRSGSQLRKIADRRTTAAGRSRLVTSNSHRSLLPF